MKVAILEGKEIVLTNKEHESMLKRFNPRKENLEICLLCLNYGCSKFLTKPICTLKKFGTCFGWLKIITGLGSGEGDYKVMGEITIQTYEGYLAIEKVYQHLLNDYEDIKDEEETI